MQNKWERSPFLGDYTRDGNLDTQRTVAKEAFMTRVLVYSHDTYGLGNIRRMLEITTHLVGTQGQVTALVVTGSPMVHAFRIVEGIDYIKLPCVQRDAKGSSGVRSLGMDYEATIRMRANMILMAALDFAPDVVIVDKKPMGIADELRPMLHALERSPNPPRKFLLLRDILDAPEATRAQWQAGAYHEAIDRHFDRILVVGEREVFDVAREYAFPPSSAGKLRYCGYIARESRLLPRGEIRQRFGLPEEEPLVLVTVGGGADGRAVIQSYLEGLILTGPEPGWRTLLVAGPELASAERAELTELITRCPSVVCIDFTREMLSCMNAADLVVAMGGYNTVCELLTLRKPALLVPRTEPVQEQWIRADRMQRMGLLSAIHPEQLTPQSLVDAVRASLKLAALQAQSPAFEMRGLNALASEIEALLLPQAQLHQVAVKLNDDSKEATLGRSLAGPSGRTREVAPAALDAELREAALAMQLDDALRGLAQSLHHLRPPLQRVFQSALTPSPSLGC
jgi:predicted glycosyltransferase